MVLFLKGEEEMERIIFYLIGYFFGKYEERIMSIFRSFLKNKKPVEKNDFYECTFTEKDFEKKERKEK